MVYRGENVTLGYANSQEDLLKCDENYGIMHTGDLARRDADGCYFIHHRPTQTVLENLWTAYWIGRGGKYGKDRLSYRLLLQR